MTEVYTVNWTDTGQTQTVRTPRRRVPRPLRSRALATAAAMAALLLAPGCDRGLEAEPPLTGISGTVTFVGEWTEEIGQVAVAVYRDLPEEVEDLFGLSGTDLDAPLGSRSYDYFVPLQREGTYRWIVVAWRRPEAFWDFTSLLGCYHVEGDSLPGAVEVTPGQVTTGIDMTIDLGVIADPPELGSTPCTAVLPESLIEAAQAGQE